MKNSNTWNRPNTKAPGFIMARAMATRCGLNLDAANTQGAAVRNGRYWVTAQAGKKRVFTADTLARMIHFLEHYSTPVQPQSDGVVISTLLRFKSFLTRK